MKTYNEFHGEIEITNIGKRLRDIVKSEKGSFKIMTGYGSTCGKSKSKEAAIKSLIKMKKEKLIKGFILGELKNIIIDSKSPYYEDKVNYSNSIKMDSDYGNDGIIFVIK